MQFEGRANNVRARLKISDRSEFPEEFPPPPPRSVHSTINQDKKNSWSVERPSVAILLCVQKSKIGHRSKILS